MEMFSSSLRYSVTKDTIWRRLIGFAKSIDFAQERPMNVKSFGNFEIFQVILNNTTNASELSMKDGKKRKLIDVNVT